MEVLDLKAVIFPLFLRIIHSVFRICWTDISITVYEFVLSKNTPVHISGLFDVGFLHWNEAISHEHFI